MTTNNHKDKKKKVEEKPRREIGKLLHKLTNNLLLITFIGGIVTVFVTGAGFVYKNLQEQLNEFGSTIMEVVFVNEDQYSLCQTMAGTPSLFQANKIFALRKELRTAIEKLLLQRSALGRYISYDDYLSTAELVCWNAKILDAGMNVCSMNLKPFDRSDKWMKKMLQKVVEDKERHQQWSYIFFKDYLNFIVSFFSPRKGLFEETYPAPKCDFSKIEAY